jgi:predicted DNA-binding transcriptional regulator AlpA
MGMLMDMSMAMDLLTAKDVKKILRCSLPLVYRMADRGQLPCVRWECPGEGNRKKTMVRFEPEAIREFIENHREG